MDKFNSNRIVRNKEAKKKLNIIWRDSSQLTITFYTFASMDPTLDKICF